MAIIRPWDRPAFPVRDASLSELGTIQGAVRSIGRIELEGHPYLPWVGTGFLVSPRRFLLARYAAEIFCEGKGDAGLTLKSGFKVFLSSPPELSETVRFRLPVTAVRFLHPFFQVALCELGAGDIEMNSEDAEVGLTLAADEAACAVGRKVAVLGFAAPDSRSVPEVQKKVYGDIFDVLYFQPGELVGMTDRARTPALDHDCSTTGGSGGAPLIDLESGLVLGLHYAGLFMAFNSAVPGPQLARDRRVRAHGVIFSDDPPWMRDWIAQSKPEDAPPPPVTEPAEVDAEVRHFNQTNLYRLRDLLADAGFAQEDRQYLLFVSMNQRYVSTLPTEGSPGARLLNVLNTLNHTPILTNGELPFRTLLFNAVENSKPLPVSAKLQKYLDQLPLA